MNSAGNKPTSDGLRELLQRNGITPTGNSARDIELAREFMPINWSDYMDLKNEILSAKQKQD